MPIKTTGAELKAFYNDEKYWGKTQDSSTDIWHEELVIEVNGVEQPDGYSIDDNLKDEDQVNILNGYVMSNQVEFAERSLESFFKAWRKIQNTAYLSVEVPKDKLEAVRAAILAAGGKLK